MDELDEVKRRLSILEIRQNGYIKVEDVRNVINFIEGLMMLKKENEDETK